MTCNICAENYNKSTRMLVGCPYCNYDACRECWSTWFLDNSEPKCMSPECGKDWTRAHIRERFTVKFLTKDLKAHREQILFDKERALMPATQPHIEVIRLRQHADRRIAEYRQEYREIQRKIDVVEQEFLNQRTVLLRLTRNPTSAAAIERAAFVKACPREECRGFLSTQWKCGTCEYWTCPHCHVVKGTERNCEHECNPDDLATAKLIAADTKPCPKCGMGIYKIDGCDQMWCTQCHTAFSFRTGRIETNVHNPHYYEWMRRNGNAIPRAQGDGPIGCDNTQLNQYTVRTYSQNIVDCSRKLHGLVRKLHGSLCNNTQYQLIDNALEHIAKYVEQLGRQIIHVRFAEMDRYENVANAEQDHLELRIEYMLNNLSEADFKTRIQRLEKQKLKSREIHNVLNLYYNGVCDILARSNDFVQRHHFVNSNILMEINALSAYAGECFDEIAHTYNCSAQTLNKMGVHNSTYTNIIDSAIYTCTVDIDAGLCRLCELDGDTVLEKYHENYNRATEFGWNENTTRFYALYMCYNTH